MSDVETPQITSTAVRTGALVATLGLVTGGLIALGAPPAAAGQCSSSTGGSSDTVMWTGSSYTCAYQSKSDKKKIGAFKTYTWMSNTALGYTKREHRWKQTGGVDTSYVYVDGGGTTGSSITFTAFNTEDGSRHWGAAVMWNTPQGGKISSSQYKGDDYEFKTNRFYVSKISVSGPSSATAGAPTAFSVKVTDPDGKSTPAGTIALMLQPGSKPSPTTTDCNGKVTSQGADSGLAKSTLSGGAGTLTAPGLAPGTYTMYAVYAGSLNSSGRPLYCNSPSNSGLTGAQSSSWTLTVSAPAETRPARTLLSAPEQTTTPALATAPAGRPVVSSGGISIVDRTFVTGRDGGAPALPMACPAGSRPLQVNAASPTRVLPERLLERGSERTGIRPGTAPEGTRIDVQVVCRDRSAGARTLDRLVLGTLRADRLHTRLPGSTVLAGRGDDRIVVRTPGSSVLGFTGDDRIEFRTHRGSVHGGPGDDVLHAHRPGAVLLVGGTGRDTFHGAHGRTLINAVDGRGGDLVVCHSPRNVVLADAGDRLVGPCTVR